MNSAPLKLAVFGAGAMANALAPRFAAAGHHLTISSRSLATGGVLAATLGVEHLAWRMAAARADVILLAVHWDGVERALSAAGAEDGVMHGKVIIDCGNPVEIERFTVTQPETSLTERVAHRTGADVAKAFNLCHADVWAATQGGAPVPVAATGERALDAARRLAGDLGHKIVHVGGAEQARQLEQTAALVIRLLFAGAAPTTTFGLIGIVDDRRSVD